MRIRRKIAIAAATGAVIVLATTPALAALSGWMYSNGNVTVAGCESQVIIGTQRVSAQELNQGPACSAAGIWVQSKWTPNGVNYYNSSFAYDSVLAIKSAYISVAAQEKHY